MGEKHDALKIRIYHANRRRIRQRHKLLKQRVYEALDTMIPEAAGVSLLLDIPCEMVDGALGPPMSDESLELRHDYVYEWAKDRGVEIRI